MAGMNQNPRRIVAFGQDLEARFHEVLKEDQALSLGDLALDGHDIMRALDLEPGPVVGQILRHLLDRVLDTPSLNERGKLEALAQEYLGSLPDSRV